MTRSYPDRSNARTTAARSASLRSDLLSPIFEEIAERLLEGDTRRPADRMLDLLGATTERGHVGRTQAGGIRSDLDPLQLRARHEEVQHPLDGPVDAGAEIVDLARRAALEQRPVATHDVPHVGEVPRRLQIADQHHRLAKAGLRFRDLLGKARGGEGIASTRSGMVERARAHDVEAVALPVLEPHQVLG